MILTDETRLILRHQLQDHEGLRLKAYQDTEGVWTIGYGHTGGVKEGWTINAAMAERLLDDDIKNAEIDAAQLILYPNVISQIRLATLVNMCFNLGMPRLNGFRRMWRAIECQDWRKAAGEMINSKWSGQVGSRAFQLAYQMRLDRWWRA